MIAGALPFPDTPPPDDAGLVEPDPGSDALRVYGWRKELDAELMKDGYLIDWSEGPIVDAGPPHRMYYMAYPVRARR